MPKHKARASGRPSKLTAAVERSICSAIAGGTTYAVACAFAGVDVSTVRRWLSSPAPRCRAFRRAVERAEAEVEVRAVAIWQKHIPDDWRAARDFLARRFPQRWG